MCEQKAVSDGSQHGCCGSAQESDVSREEELDYLAVQLAALKRQVREMEDSITSLAQKP